MSTCGKGSLPFPSPSRTGSCIVDATDLAAGLIQFAISAIVHQTSTRLWHRCSKMARKTLPRPNYGLGSARKGEKGSSHNAPEVAAHRRADASGLGYEFMLDGDQLLNECPDSSLESLPNLLMVGRTAPIAELLPRAVRSSLQTG
ncbi:hypothetical protein CKAH01_02789 [Colletotrichum kahawae]|uniref:Uncharacterized protein n=1 Tax=Colletotrichum kahawae TaxID=34407 RepID=A0AAD9XVC4_COLKA|nr:hypothetical protein CKAH01_02789 [Colletotrichum kahawae]